MDAARLKAIPLFAGLGKKELKRVASMALALDAQPGDRLLNEGAYAFEFFANHYAAYGYWLLTADAPGQITGFTASYTQRDYRGVVLSPLILAVHTNVIVHGDVVPSGGQAVQVVAAPKATAKP